MKLSVSIRIGKSYSESLTFSWPLASLCLYPGKIDISIRFIPGFVLAILKRLSGAGYLRKRYELPLTMIKRIERLDDIDGGQGFRIIHNAEHIPDYLNIYSFSGSNIILDKYFSDHSL